MTKDNNQTEDRYALLSVYDKTGIADFAKNLQDLGYKIISTGGTAKFLAENNIKIIPIQEITGNSESFDGRMKTISFQIESGILFDRQNKKHLKEAQELGIKQIDIVVCNLYPFEKTISDPKVKLEDAIENIDVGGPTMVRAAAKNFKNVLVVVDPDDYEKVSDYLNCHSERSEESCIQETSSDSSPAFGEAQNDIKQQLAAKAFAHLSFYDSQIAKYLNAELFPNELTIAGRKFLDLRYGENPHQKASLYLYPNANSPFNNLRKLWGRGLGWMNIADINSGLESVKLFEEPAAVIIKHNCPCGIALGKNSSEALKRAIESDPESAFGGIIVLNRELDLKAAKEIGAFKDEKKSNIDIVAVPSITKDALEYLKQVRKSMGIYTFGNIKYQTCLPAGKVSNIKYQISPRYVLGGFLAQTTDNNIDEGFEDWKVATKKQPTKKQLEQMQIAWKFISRIKSNAIIILDKEIPMTRGIGTGQTSRIRSVKIAIEQAAEHARGAILASDSFFPFDDSVKIADKAGIAGIVQQGGSLNDKLSIEAADKAGIAMIFTGRRAFWH